jgi:hypothetical protein
MMWLKYKRNKPQEELCVQFFVREKQRQPLSRPLPKFVYGVSGGRIDRSVKFPTDVIKVGKLHLACGAGTRLEALGSAGTATLFFRNRAEPSQSVYYVLTCSHVVGDLTDSPPVNDEVNCPDCIETSPFGNVIKNSISRGEPLEYDIALARLTDSAVKALGADRLRQLDGRVEDEDLVLTKILDAKDIRPSVEVDCNLARSGSRSGRVRSFAGSFLAELRGRELLVHNLYILDVAAVPGDSGGLIYSDDCAIGVIVARSPDGWAWFHSLQGAIGYLGKLDPQLDLQCFD